MPMVEGGSNFVDFGSILHAKMAPGLSLRLEFRRFWLHFACPSGPGALPGQPPGAPGASGPSPAGPPGGSKDLPRAPRDPPGDIFGPIFEIWKPGSRLVDFQEIMLSLQ